MKNLALLAYSYATLILDQTIKLVKDSLKKIHFENKICNGLRSLFILQTLIFDLTVLKLINKLFKLILMIKTKCNTAKDVLLKY